MSGADDYPAGYGGGGYRVTYGGGPPQDPEEVPQPTLANPEAEAATLGALMINNNLIPFAAERLSPEDFYEPIHAKIFAAIVRLHEKGRGPNPVLLRPIFEHDRDMAQVGGPTYLAELTGSMAALVGAYDFIDQIAELAVRRRAVEAMDVGRARLIDTSGDGGMEEVDDVISTVQDTAYAAMVRAEPMKSQTSGEMIGLVRARQEEIQDKGEAVGIRCRSIPDVDKVLGPLEPGYHVIGGRPGMLKTTLAATMAWGYSANGAAGEYYLSEMTPDQMGMRQASDLSQAMRLPLIHEKIRAGALSPKEMEDLAQVEEMAASLPLSFVDTGSCDIRRVEAMASRAKIRWKKRGKDLKYIVVDYLQNFEASDERGRPITDETAKVTAISKTCLRIAKRLGIAVIALSQLGRQVEERKDKRPQINDLRQSGNIEQDADTVSLLFREEVYWKKEKPKKPETDPAVISWQQHMDIIEGELEMIGEKHRHQKPRTKTLRFLPRHYAIRSHDYRETDVLLGPELFPGAAADQEEF